MTGWDSELGHRSLSRRPIVVASNYSLSDRAKSSIPTCCVYRYHYRHRSSDLYRHPIKRRYGESEATQASSMITFNCVLTLPVEDIQVGSDNQIRSRICNRRIQ